MNKINKRGLSPAIATVLLISLALILAALIFIWASSLLKEKNQKFGEPIENACEKVNFGAEAYSNQLHVVNRGKVPIQGFEIKKKGDGSVESFGTVGGDNTLAEGENGVFELKGLSGENIIVTPIIYGLQKGQRTPHICDESGIEILVESNSAVI